MTPAAGTPFTSAATSSADRGSATSATVGSVLPQPDSFSLRETGAIASHSLSPTSGADGMHRDVTPDHAFAKSSRPAATTSLADRGRTSRLHQTQRPRRAVLPRV